MAGNCGFLPYFGADGTGSGALPTAVSASKRERSIEIRGIARAGIRITHVPQSWRSACPDRSVREDGSDNDAYVKCASPAGRIWAHSLTSISSPSMEELARPSAVQETARKSLGHLQAVSCCHLPATRSSSLGRAAPAGPSSQSNTSPQTQKAAPEGGFCCVMSVVAGVGFEPTTFRL